MFPKSRLALAAAALTALAVGACGGSSNAHTGSVGHPSESAPRVSAKANAAAAAVKLRTVAVSDGGSKVHQKILVNSAGRSIYLLTGDSSSHPLCTSQSCLAAWPAVKSSAKQPKLGAGVHGKLTVWTHKGVHQLVLNGHPLYLFAGDSSAAANGNGVKSFGGTWWVMSGQGAAAQLHAAVASGSSSSGSGTSSNSSDGGW